MQDESAPPDETGRADAGDQESDPTDQSRRDFLIRSIAVIGGGITVGVGVPAAIFVAGSARAPGEEEAWIRLGSASTVDIGAAPTLMKATVQRASGYLLEEQEISVFVTTDNGTDFSVLSNICTHLGCRVRWVEDQTGFFCPCHNAVFDRDGEVVQGPPPAPLAAFESKVEDGQLYFKEA